MNDENPRALATRLDIIKEVMNTSPHGLDKNPLKKELEETLVMMYNEPINPQFSLSEFYFVTLSLNIYTGSDLLENSDMNYLSDMLSDHTTKIIKKPMTRINFALNDADESSEAAATGHELYHFRADKCLFNAGILHRYHKHAHHAFGEKHLTSIGKQSYEEAAANTYINSNTARFLRFAENFEFIKENLKNISDKYVFSQDNKYYYKAVENKMKSLTRNIPFIN